MAEQRQEISQLFRYLGIWIITAIPGTFMVIYFIKLQWGIVNKGLSARELGNFARKTNFREIFIGQQFELAWRTELN